jgi:hypothetical protein
MKRALIVSSLTLFALGAAYTQTSNSKNQNEKLADSLMNNFKKKIDKSLANTKTGPDQIPRKCIADEMDFTLVEREILVPIQEAIKTKNPNVLEEIATIDPSRLGLVIKKNFDGVSYKKYKLPLGASLGMMNRNLISLMSLNFNSIEHAEIVGLKYKSLPNKRDENSKMKSFVLTAKFDLRGTGKKANLLQERGIVDLSFAKKGNNWKVESATFIELETLEAKKAQFTNSTKKLKVSSLVPSHLRREAIRRGGYAMAINDVNGDKYPDLFVATVAETVMLNQKDGKYQISEQKGLESQSLVKAAAFADFDNNGSDELLVVRFAPNEKQEKNNRSDILVYENKNNKFQKTEGVIGFEEKTSYAMPLALADFNNDNKLDFYIGFPGAKDFTTLDEAKHASGLLTQGIFLNKKGEKNYNFSLDSKMNIKSSYDKSVADFSLDDELSRIFPHSALAVDYNDDGHSDIVVIDDRGNLSPIYTNLGNGKFKFTGEEIGFGLKDYGMGITVGDLNNDGKKDFLMSSVNFNSSSRLKESCKHNWSEEGVISAGVRGLRAFEANKNGTFSESTEKFGLEWIGEGAGGVTLVDYNNDGYEDIYVVNGLWTGSEMNQSEDLGSMFVAGSTLGILEDNLRSELRNNNFKYERVIKNNDYKSLVFRSDSQSAIMDLLSFYKGSLSEGKKANRALSLAGAQRNRMFRNNGDGTFTEVGYMLGVDSIADGYMAATADINRDGKLDLVLRNADPGYKKDQFDPVEVFVNNAQNENSVILSLEGTRSNRNAVGAKIIAEIDGKVLKRELLGNAGTVQSERIIHLGLGKSKKINKLVVKWPSGNRSILKNLKKGHHKIIEKDSPELKSKVSTL